MSLQERLDIIRSSPAPRNEESAKFQILAPILQSLGWDPSEVDLEYSAGGKRSGGRIDMALKTARQVVALIEAKAPGANLNDHVDQVIGYAHHEGVDVCVLTTGLEWWLYLPRERGRPPKRRFAVLQLMEDPLEELAADLTTFLGRESLVNGKAEELAKIRLEHVRLNSEVPSIWKQMLQEPDDELVGLVQKRVHERTHLKLTSEQIAAALRGAPIPSASSEVAPPAAPRPTAPLEQDQPAQWWQSWGTPTAILLWGKSYPATTHVGTFRKFLDVLYDRHSDDFDRALEVSLPNRRVPHVAADQKELGPRGEREYHEPEGSGVFFTEHSHPEAIKEIATALLEHFGHSASDFKVLYD